MSNLVVQETSTTAVVVPDDVLTEALRPHLTDHGSTFVGRVEGLPDYDEEFLRAIRSIMVDGTMTQISGMQLKVPMHLTNGALRLAKSESFTHILKMPNDARLMNLAVREWLGMTLARAAGAVVPDFALVDLAVIEPGTADSSDYQNRGLRRVHALDIDNLPSDNLAPSDEEVANRLSDQMYSTSEMGAQFWTDVLGKVDNGLLSATRVAGEVPLAFVVERFDIPTDNDPRWRLSEDFCSLTHRVADNRETKYSASILEVARTLKAKSSAWIPDAREFYRQLAVAVLVCNTDQHLKNISLLSIASPDNNSWDEVALSPVYDMTVTGGMPRITKSVQALPLVPGGGRLHTRGQLIAFAEKHLEIPRSEGENMLNGMIDGIRRRLAMLHQQSPAILAGKPSARSEFEIAMNYVEVNLDQYVAPVMAARMAP